MQVRKEEEMEVERQEEMVYVSAGNDYGLCVDGLAFATLPAPHLFCERFCIACQSSVQLAISHSL